MAALHPFGTILRHIRMRVPGLTQARLAALAGYDPAVITRMTRGRQDLIGPQTRTRILRVIQALDQAGALDGLEDANALLVAANLSPLIAATAGEAELIQRISLHSGMRSTTRYGNPPMAAPAHVRHLLHEYARVWDLATNDAERVVTLAAAGALAMRHGQPLLGMRLLACAAHNEDIVLAADCVIQGAFQQHIAEARVHLPHSAYANAWAAGQLLTLSEARAWLASLPGLIAPRTEIST